MQQLVLIAHNLRSTHNVGSLLRTADGLGVHMVYLTGYTPYPKTDNDDRLPYIAEKLQRQIEKTALGAETTQKWQHVADVQDTLNDLHMQGYVIAALEQSAASIPLPDYIPPPKLALLVGREVEGVEPEILKLCDDILEIPMFGRKESFNVVQAAAMGLYHCRFRK